MERTSEDMIIHILLRLPVKSLGRFKCVSKKWNRFISCDPYFRKNYKEVGGSTLMLGLFYQQLGKVGKVNFPQFAHSSDEGKMLKKWKGEGVAPFDESLGFIDESPQTLVAVSNGVLLVCSEDRVKPSNYYVCNPITKKWLSLPTPKKAAVIVTSFICNESFNNYKVVRAIWPQDYLVLSTTLNIEIFDNQIPDLPNWKEFNLTCSTPFKFNLNGLGVISEKSGIVYWPVHTQDSSTDYSCDSVILFDQKHTSHLEVISLPNGERRTRYQYDDFGKTNGLIVYARHNEYYIDMWVLNEDTKGWCMKYNVENAVNPFSFIELFHPLHPHLILLRLINRKVVWYNLESENIDLYPSLEDHPEGIYVFLPYICTSWPPSFLLFQQSVLGRQEGENQLSTRVNYRKLTSRRKRSRC